MLIIHTLDKDNIRKRSANFPWPWSRNIKKLKECVFAEDGGRVVGVCGISSIFNILLIFVVEEYRNKGVGKALLSNMITTAERERHHFITLKVGWGDKDYNIPARTLFQRHGFKKVIDINKQTVMILPLRKTTGKLAFICINVLLSALPKMFLIKMLGSISRFVTT